MYYFSLPVKCQELQKLLSDIADIVYSLFSKCAPNILLDQEEVS